MKIFLNIVKNFFNRNFARLICKKNYNNKSSNRTGENSNKDAIKNARNISKATHLVMYIT